MTISDINTLARRWANATTTTYTAANLLIDINQAYETVVGWIINTDGTWQFDDTNYSDFPIGTFTLVNSQDKYSFNDRFLQIEEVQVMDKEGNYRIITPIDQSEYSDLVPLTEAYKTDGLPEFYDKISDDTIRLFPAPDNGVSVTLAAGLKIKFKRTADLYTSAQVTTGTKVPGFVSTGHIILAYMAASTQCSLYKPERVPTLNALIGDTNERTTGLKAAILKQYGLRQKDVRNVMTPRKKKYI